MRHTDVLVGLHGSGLNNAMFMEPGSVVIAIMPSNYVECVRPPPASNPFCCLKLAAASPALPTVTRTRAFWQVRVA